MKDIGIEIELNTPPFNRSIQFLSLKKTIIILFFYVLFQVTIIIFNIFGPPPYISQRAPFIDVKPYAPIRNFSFDFINLNYFNSFISFGLVFNKTGITLENNTHVFTYENRVYMKSGKFITKQAHSPPHKVETKINSDFSAPINVLTCNFIDFSAIRAEITISFISEFLPGYFEWTFTDQNLAIMQCIIRAMIFIFVFYLLASLHGTGITFSSSPISLKLAFLSNIGILIASNPFYFLNYVTSWHFVKYYDTVMSVFVCVFVLYASIIVLFSTEKHSELGFAWFVPKFIPLLIVAGVFEFSAIHNLHASLMNRLVQVDFVYEALRLAKAGIFGIILISLFVGFFTFKTDITQERPLYTITSLVLMIAMFTSEYLWTKSVFVGAENESRIFSLLAATIYVAFFTGINWPCEGQKIQGNLVSIEEGREVEDFEERIE